jgi:hypothetical protein
MWESVQEMSLEHDYGDDATVLANFLTDPYPTLRQQAAITTLVMVVESGRPLPIVDEDAVDVCAAAILEVTRRETNGPVSPGVCATLAHRACRAFARLERMDPDARGELHAMLAIGAAAGWVLLPGDR